MIGANLPDVDVLAYLWGPGADLLFRRGWTHGVLALALWPFALTAGMVLLDRGLRRLRRERPSGGTRPRQLLLLSTISVLSHPILDTLNTYGVRWLMPFSERWFYGDTLFIVDPWLWLALATGVVLSRRRHAARPARVALWLAFGYAVAMAAGALAARRIAAAELASISGAPVDRLLVSPLPVSPLRRSVVAEQGEVYRTGQFRWLGSPHLDPASLRVYPKGPREHPAVKAATTSTLGRRFLAWARFPAFQLGESPAGEAVVHIVDLRYADRPGVRFGAVTIPVGGPAQFEIME